MGVVQMNTSLKGLSGLNDFYPMCTIASLFS